MNTPVSFSLAKLLKEKGYDNPTRDCYNVHGLSFSNGWCEYIEDDFEFDGLVKANKLRKEDTLAPTIADVIIWLYEKYNIWISVDPEIDTNTWFHTITHGKSTTAFGNYSGPIEAYEKGIEHVLNEMI